MTTEEGSGAAAAKAHATMRRRGKPPSFDRSSPQGRVEICAWRAASAAINRALNAQIEVDEDWMLKAPDRIKQNDYRCELTGLRFDVDNFKTPGAGGTHYAPSPDRIDPKKGYVEGNVRWVLWAVNRAKGEMPDERFIEIFRALIDRIDEKRQ